MSIDRVLSELKAMYRADLEGTDTAITRLATSDIQRWSADLAMPKSVLYDLLALHLASGFYRNELPFAFLRQRYKRHSRRNNEGRRESTGVILERLLGI